MKYLARVGVNHETKQPSPSSCCPLSLCTYLYTKLYSFSRWRKNIWQSLKNPSVALNVLCSVADLPVSTSPELGLCFHDCFMWRCSSNRAPGMLYKLCTKWAVSQIQNFPFSNIAYLFSYLLRVLVHVFYVGAGGLCVWKIRAWTVVCSVLPLCVTQGSNSARQAWLQAPLPMEPSR